MTASAHHMTAPGLALLLLAGAAPLGAQMTHPEPPPFLQVSGTAEVSIPSDRAQVRFAVETEAPTAREASTENAERMERVMTALRGTGLEGLEIETSGYDLQPRYRRPDQTGTRTIDGYRALNHVEVTVDDVSGVGRLIDAAIGAGANRVAGLTFSARDTGPARQEAVRTAVLRAREEAEAMASALGARLGEPLEVQGGAQLPGPRPMPYRMEMAQAADMETPVEPGEHTVYANVTIRYRLITPQG